MLGTKRGEILDPLEVVKRSTQDTGFDERV